jgi:CBS domain-containing protein
MNTQKNAYKVRDLVIDDEYSTIGSEATILETAKKMKESGIPDLVVLDSENEQVLGVIDDFDIVNEIVAEGKDASAENVKTAMYKIEPVTLDTPVEEAYLRMRDLKVTVVPVVDTGKLLGVCTIQDCWSYIPQEGVDKIGLIHVKNSRLAEFWLASICSIAAFIIGIVFPLTGLFGYIIADTSQVENLFRMVNIRGGPITFFLFEAHGTQLFMNYADLATRAGSTWILMLIFGIALLAFAIIGIFSIFYSSFANLKQFHVGKLHQRAFPLLTAIFIVVEWILYLIIFGTASPAISFSIDPVGLTCSIVAIGLILLAIFRDYIFAQKVGGA